MVTLNSISIAFLVAVHLLSAVQVLQCIQFKHETGLYSLIIFSAFSGSLRPDPFEFSCFPGLRFGSLLSSL